MATLISFGAISGGLAALQQRSTWVLARIWAWSEVRRQRRQLLTLDERALQDIGISRADAEREAARPFWDQSASDHVGRSQSAADGSASCHTLGTRGWMPGEARATHS